jgi:hypothetical protein
MEARSPHARYAVAEKREAGWTIELIMLPYEWEQAARRAEENGREEWAYSLRTGLALKS